MEKKIYPVIMCGGAGTRLWPLSRQNKAKQYHPLVTENTMLQETILRMDHAGEFNIADPSFVCGANDELLVKVQCQEIGKSFTRVILEPFGRNTAPLAAIVADVFQKIDEDGLVLLLPADHHIAQPADFWGCVEKGMDAASNGKIVTLGIGPDRPETGYGYIKRGKQIEADVYHVEAFVEKPNVETAEIYLSSGAYFWNAGIFLFNPKTMQASFERHANEILHASRATLAASDTDSTCFLLDKNQFANCPSDSIDYAIMEKAKNVAIVAPVDIGWSDIGSWSEFARKADNKTLETTSDSNVIAIDCENTFIKTDGPLVAGVGLENLIIVVEDGKILIVPKDRAQDVKKVVAHLKETGRDDLC